MKNTFGTALTITLFGESHGPAIGAVLDGISPGIKIDDEYIEKKLAARKPYGRISTKRQEPDRIEFLSGVFEGYTTGTPLCIIIRNQDTRSRDYGELKDKARPSHADYTAFCKYGGFQDYRGGGHFSGRITAALVAAGAILNQALERKGIAVATHIKSCHGVRDRNFEDVSRDISLLNDRLFPVLDSKAGDLMKDEIADAASEGDSVGGVLETVIAGLPAGLGEPWFDTFESLIAHAMFSIPAVKGVEFGAGFDICNMRGSEANDAMRYDEHGRVVTTTNNSGGINGGITNGMPVLFRTAVKPTPSIFVNQETIDFVKQENTQLCLKGRHDPAIVHRASAVVDAMTAIVTADLLTVRYGTGFLGGEK